MERISQIISRINKFFAETVASLIMVALTLLVVYEVISRYFFNAPTIWSMEVSQYMFCAISMLTGGYCLSREGHVRVDLFYPKMTRKTQAVIEIVTFTLVILLCAILIWIGGTEFWNILSNRTTSGSVAALPLWPVWLMIPLGGVLLLLQVVARYITNIRILVGEN